MNIKSLILEFLQNIFKRSKLNQLNHVTYYNIMLGDLFDLKSLKIIYSTGSPLKPESYDYVYKFIKKDVCLSSITGGTDIISLFAGHNIAGPVYRGEIQCRCLVTFTYIREWL